MRTGYLLDTSQFSQAVLPGSPVRDGLRLRLAKGIRVGICVPVLCEVEAGIQGVRDPRQYREHLMRTLQSVRVWPIDGDTAREYGRIVAQLRAAGRVLSQIDVMLAALARQMRLVLVTSDNDFEALSDIPKENWAG